jgi:hypothetical protein
LEVRFVRPMHLFVHHVFNYSYDCFVYMLNAYIYIYIFIMIDYCQGDDQNSGPDATSMRIIQLLGNKEKNPIIYYVDNYIFSVSQSSLYLIH